MAATIASMPANMMSLNADKELPVHLCTGCCNDKFDSIGYEDTAGDRYTLVPMTASSSQIPMLTMPSIDLTAVVAEVNTFFGFSFAIRQCRFDKHFEAKTVGNPVVVTDTYAYVTAVVTDGDGDVDIAPTGDFSANIVIVMAASAVLAAAALAFVAKKARD